MRSSAMRSCSLRPTRARMASRSRCGADGVAVRAGRSGDRSGCVHAGAGGGGERAVHAYRVRRARRRHAGACRADRSRSRGRSARSWRAPMRSSTAPGCSPTRSRARRATIGSPSIRARVSSSCSSRPARRCSERIVLPVPSAGTKGVLVFPTVDGKLVAGPTAHDQDDKHDWSVRRRRQRRCWARRVP